MSTMRRDLPAACLLAIAVMACGQGPATTRSPEKVSVDERIARITSAVTPLVMIEGGQPAPVTLDERMRQLGVPGVGIAVVDHGAVEWARGFGAADVEAGRPVTDEWMPESRTTLFGTRLGNTIDVSWNDDGTVNRLELAGRVFEKVG
jgi:CubicO group peptidase (beta-lactamase class C family)